MSDITFEIKERIGVLTESPTGWTKEINLVAWNGGKPKWDIRDWNPDHTSMSRGLTLNDAEMKKLLSLMKGRM